MSNLFKKLSSQQKKDFMDKVLKLPEDKKVKVLLHLLKQPT